MEPILGVTSWPDSEVHGANMGPTLVLSAPGGSPVGLMTLLAGYMVVDVSCTQQSFVNGNHTRSLREVRYVFFKVSSNIDDFRNHFN